MSFRIKMKTENLFFLLRLTFIVLLFCFIFYFLENFISLRHEISVFISFLLLPLIVLVVKSGNIFENGKSTNISKHALISGIKRIIGEINKGFFEGILIYLAFTVIILCFYYSDRKFFEGYEKMGFTFFTYMFFTMLNVIPIDFFSKRFIQYPLIRRFGNKPAVALQTLVWSAAHIPESLWLDDLMGFTGAWCFLVSTGLITGVSYSRTKNAAGQMSGHVILNLTVVLAVNANL